MNTTQALIDRVKSVRGLPSDYKLAEHLGVTRAAVSNWRKGASQMDDTTALQIAEDLGLDPLEVMARLKLERHHTPRDERVWGKRLGRVLVAAASAAIVTGGLGSPKIADAKGFDRSEITRSFQTTTIYIMRTSR